MSRTPEFLMENVNRYIWTTILLALPVLGFAQLDSLGSKLSWHGDFRFRFEQDWNSRKSDGTFRPDRFRMRYRVRLGVKYQYRDWATVGVTLRTGDPGKQQDPQLTLGDAFKEFGTLPIAFEKAYFLAHHNKWTFWAGKNTFPFEKQNELFWSDNVYPEGLYVKKSFSISSSVVNQVDLQAGHFVINTRGRSLDGDSYVQGFQVCVKDENGRFVLFPSMFLFRNIQDQPDGAENFLLDYTIFQLGLRLKPFNALPLSMELDVYQNLEDYTSSNSMVPVELADERLGYTIAVGFGDFDEKGDWLFKVTYTHLERYSAVDFLAQNDWARWDYGSVGSPDGRLTNMAGAEFVIGYRLNESMVLKTKIYTVEQLVARGTHLENGDRIRFDLDVKF